MVGMEVRRSPHVGVMEKICFILGEGGESAEIKRVDSSFMVSDFRI